MMPGDLVRVDAINSHIWLWSSLAASPGGTVDAHVLVQGELLAVVLSNAYETAFNEVHERRLVMLDDGRIGWINVRWLVGL